ncbi:hypothetical protein METP3_00589 [Methanosarcinales archaeon]|nr:hypothetical protein METP3_00589 [Methanosarcinales archaeon]
MADFTVSDQQTAKNAKYARKFYFFRINRANIAKTAKITSNPEIFGASVGAGVTTDTFKSSTGQEGVLLPLAHPYYQ